MRQAPTGPCWSALSCGAAWAVHVAAGHPERVLGLVRHRAVVRARTSPTPQRDARRVGRAARHHRGLGEVQPALLAGRRLRRLPRVLLRADVLRAALDQADRGLRRLGARDQPGHPGRHDRRPRSAATARCASRSRPLCARVQVPGDGGARHRRPRSGRTPIGERLAELTGGSLVLIEGGGHGPPARDPVRDQPADQASSSTSSARRPPARGRRGRAAPAPAQAGAVPVVADRARARPARRRDRRRAAPAAPRPARSTGWRSTRSPRCSSERGERVHPASAWLANETAHIEHEAGEHDLHAFQAIRRMDEILVAQLHGVPRRRRPSEHYDLVVGDEAWDVDYFLHENPELKRFAFAWMTDFVGWLPMPDGGDARGRAHRRLQRGDDRAARPVRPRARPVGVRRQPRRRRRRRASGRACRASGRGRRRTSTSPGTSPASTRRRGDRAQLRAERSGTPTDERVCVVTVGGSGVGDSLLRRVLDAVPAGAAARPGLRFVVVTGPRIDPASLPRRRGVDQRSGTCRTSTGTWRPATSPWCRAG